MNPSQSSKTADGYELRLGTNNVGTFMLTKLLTLTLIATAKTEPPSSVRVLWVSSSAAEGLSPKGCIAIENSDYHEDNEAMVKYGVSKAGNYLQGTEFAKRYLGDGIRLGFYTRYRVSIRIDTILILNRKIDLESIRPTPLELLFYK
jgi:retinol dehydrogenase-12